MSGMPHWRISRSPVGYEEALAGMEAQVASIIRARGARAAGAEEAAAGGECVWLLEHPPLYTAGTSARAEDLLDASRFPVYTAGRGGQYTYHGPGQRIAYVMLDLKARYAPAVPDLRDYVQCLERWLITALAAFGVQGELREGRIGVWVVTPQGEQKIAALGVRVRQGVSYHGIALNIYPDLTHYAGITPCGIREHGVTSLHALGVPVSMEEVDAVLQEAFVPLFGAGEAS